MARTVLLDAAVAATVGRRAPKAGEAEVGLAIGRRTASQDVLVHLARTPDPEEGRNAASLAGAGRAQRLEVDPAWVCEQALQASRSLPGGLSVLGAYAVAPPAATQGSAKVLASLARAARAAGGGTAPEPAGPPRDSPTPPTSDPSAILLLFDVGGNRPGVWEAAAVGDLAPRELHIGVAASQLVVTRAPVRLDLRAPGREPCEPTALRELGAALRAAARLALSEPVACAGGACLGDEERLGALVDARGRAPGEAGGGGDAPPSTVPELALELLVPAGGFYSTAASARDSALVSLSGTLDARAVLHRRETVGAAARAIAEDAADSLASRAEALADAAADAAEASGSDGVPGAGPDHSGGWPLRLPRRVWARAPGGSALPLASELLTEGEAPVDAWARLSEALGLRDTAPIGGETPLEALEATWEAVPPSRGAAASRAGAEAWYLSFSSYALAGLLVAGFSVLLAFLLLNTTARFS